MAQGGDGDGITGDFIAAHSAAHHVVIAAGSSAGGCCFILLNSFAPGVALCTNSNGLTGDFIAAHGAVHNGVIAAVSGAGGRNAVLGDGGASGVAGGGNGSGITGDFLTAHSAVHHGVIAAVSGAGGRNAVLGDGSALGMAQRFKFVAGVAMAATLILAGIGGITDCGAGGGGCHSLIVMRRAGYAICCRCRLIIFSALNRNGNGIGAGELVFRFAGSPYNTHGVLVRCQSVAVISYGNSILNSGYKLSLIGIALYGIAIQIDTGLGTTVDKSDIGFDVHTVVRNAHHFGCTSAIGKSLAEVVICVGNRVSNRTARVILSRCTAQSYQSSIKAVSYHRVGSLSILIELVGHAGGIPVNAVGEIAHSQFVEDFFLQGIKLVRNRLLGIELDLGSGLTGQFYFGEGHGNFNITGTGDSDLAGGGVIRAVGNSNLMAVFYTVARFRIGDVQGNFCTSNTLVGTKYSSTPVYNISILVNAFYGNIILGSCGGNVLDFKMSTGLYFGTICPASINDSARIIQCGYLVIANIDFHLVAFNIFYGYTGILSMIYFSVSDYCNSAACF